MINLLPPNEKKAILLEKKRKIIIILWFFAFFFLIALFLVLFCLNFYLQEKVKEQKILLENKEKEYKRLGISNFVNEVKTTNKILTQMDNFYQRKVYFTDFIDEFSRTLPQGLYLTDFSLVPDPERGKSVFKISIFGFASKRENLFELKKNLENNKNFKEIYFPLDNWIKPEDINFSVIFYLVGK